jgi:hypothetical protein
VKGVNTAVKEIAFTGERTMKKIALTLVVAVAAIVFGNLGAAQAAGIAPEAAGLNWKLHKGYSALVSADQVKEAYSACLNSTENEINFTHYYSESVDNAKWVYCD